MVWAMVRVSPLQPTRGSGGASWAPHAGSGAEPRPKTDFGVFWRPQNAPFCIYMTKIWGGQFALVSPTPNSGVDLSPVSPPWSTPMSHLGGSSSSIKNPPSIHYRAHERSHSTIPQSCIYLGQWSETWLKHFLHLCPGLSVVTQDQVVSKRIKHSTQNVW